MRHVVLVAAAGAALSLAACVAQAPQRSRTVHVQSDGSQTVGVRAAADAVPGETGPMELIGIALPLPGGFMAKAAILSDGQFPGVITLPPLAPMYAPAPYAATYAAPCAAPETVEVQEFYDEPETRMVRKVRTVRRALVPLPQAAPPPCAPPPPPAPRVAPGCEPPTARAPGGPCDVPGSGQ